MEKPYDEMKRTGVTVQQIVKTLSRIFGELQREIIRG